MCVAVLPALGLSTERYAPTEARRGRWIALELELEVGMNYHTGAGTQNSDPPKPLLLMPTSSCFLGSINVSFLEGQGKEGIRTHLRTF